MIVPVRVRYAETDQMGVAYHGDWVPWLEVARTELLRSKGLPYAELERRGLFFSVVSLSLRYLKPVRYDEEIGIEVRARRMGHVRLVFTYRILGPGGDARGEAETVLACLDREFKPRPLPDDVPREFA